MALFKPFKGSRVVLDTQPLHDGYAYFCTDDGSFHIDYVDDNGNLQRKQINAKNAETLMGMSVDEIIVQPDFAQTDSTQADYIKNKPEIDTEVIEGSENLITSGGVYEALQNIGGDSEGGTSYTAGDLIEIKDGVIRSTLGDAFDAIGLEIIADFENMPSGDINIAPPFYVWTPYLLKADLEVGQKIYMSIVHDGVEYNLGYGTLYEDSNLDNMFTGGNKSLYCTINSTVTDVGQAVMDGNLPLADESIPYSFAVFFTLGGGGNVSATFASSTDHAKDRFKLQTEKVISAYVKLPNNALTFDEVPTEDSNNLINSGDLYTYIQDDLYTRMRDTAQNVVRNALIFDDEPTENSENLVKSGAIYNAIETATDDTLIVDIQATGGTSGATLSHNHGTILNAYNAGKKIYLRSKIHSASYTRNEKIYNLSGYDNFATDSNSNFFTFSSIRTDRTPQNVVIDVWRISPVQCLHYIKEVSLDPAPEIDNEPIQDSENLITSGGVYEALQNVGGGESYTAGNLIEIENSVISSTLGKAKTVEGLVNIDELNNIPNGNSDGLPPWFLWEKEIDTTYYPEQEIHVSVIDTEGNEIYVGSGTLTTDPAIDAAVGMDIESYNEYGLYCCINSSETNLLNLLMSGSINRVDESIPYAFGIVIGMKNDGTTNHMVISSDVDYPGITIKIQEKKVYETFEKLPINASPLNDGNLIEIKNGKINSTIGKRYINNVRENIYTNFALNGDNTAMPPFYVWHTSVDQFDIKIGDKVYLYCENQTENIMKFIGSGIFEQVDELDTALGSTDRYLGCKFNVSSSWSDGLGLTDGIPKVEAENSNIVVNGNVACFCLVYDTESNYMTIISLADHPLVRFKIGKDVPTISYIKLPNEALTFDSEPIEGSENLIKSGDIYTAIQNSSSNLTYDEAPTEGSQNLLTSGTIYDVIGDVNTVINKINGLVGTGGIS